MTALESTKTQCKIQKREALIPELASPLTSPSVAYRCFFWILTGKTKTSILHEVLGSQIEDIIATLKSRQPFL
jgi:hypothetical protein